VRGKVRSAAVATVLALGGLAATGPAAQADATVDYWYCTSAWTWKMISKYDFMGCPFESILIVDHYGNKKRLLDGWCANQLWQKNRATTWYDAYTRCVIRVY
jgi:hypothetical protein